MKHSLHVVDESRDPPIWTPVLLRMGRRLVSIVDTEDGKASRRFDDEDDAEPDLRIVIRGTPASAQARLRAEILEEAADLVLGAARPAFARLLASACACRVND